MRSAISLIFTIFSGLGGIVGVTQWDDLDDNWRYGWLGFIVGLMVVLIPGILLWDSPYRQARREREQKKIELVQQLPTKSEQLDQLDDKIALAETGIETSKIQARKHREESQHFLYLGTSHEHDFLAVAADWSGNAKMGETNLEKFKKERARVEALTDEQWRAEQEAKIYVPES